MSASLVGSEMCIRDRPAPQAGPSHRELEEFYEQYERDLARVSGDGRDEGPRLRSLAARAVGLEPGLVQL
eukprot:3548738-Alexandrium_andersonii.AAC.1